MSSRPRAIAAVALAALGLCATAANAAATKTGDGPCAARVEWRERVYEQSDEAAGAIVAELGAGELRPCATEGSARPASVLRIDGEDAEDAVAVSDPSLGTAPVRFDRVASTGRSGVGVVVLVLVLAGSVVLVEVGRRRMRRLRGG